MIAYDTPTDQELQLLRLTGALQDQLPPAPARASLRLAPHVVQYATATVQHHHVPPVRVPQQPLLRPHAIGNTPWGVRMVLQLLAVLVALVLFATLAFAEPAPASTSMPETPTATPKAATATPEAATATPAAHTAAPTPSERRAVKRSKSASSGKVSAAHAPVDTTPEASGLPPVLSDIHREPRLAATVQVEDRTQALLRQERDDRGTLDGDWGTTVLGAVRQVLERHGNAIGMPPYAIAMMLIALSYAVFRRMKVASTFHGATQKKGSVAPAQVTMRKPVAVPLEPIDTPVTTQTNVALPIRGGCAAARGNVRPRMEDRVQVVANGGIVASVVADGMGGYKFGAEAAEAASRAAAKYLAQSAEPSMACLQQAFEEAARAVSAGAQAIGISGNTAFRTTLLLAVVGKGQLAFGYVGDGSLTVVRGSDGVATKLLTPHHDNIGMLTASVGPSGIWGVPTYGVLRMEDGDAVVIGTDGLDRCESHDELARWLVNMAVNGKTPSDGLVTALDQYTNTKSSDGQWAVDDNSAVAVLLAGKVKEVQS